MKKRRPRKRPRLVEVEWRDAASHLRWFDEGQAGELATCLTAGYVVKRDKRKIVVAQTLGVSLGRAMTTGHQAIPVGCVVRVRGR